jgi:hypothetical protein
MFLLRTLLLWVGCGLISLVTERLFASDEPSETRNPAPAPRANRIITLQFVEPQLEMTSLSLKGPSL